MKENGALDQIFIPIQNSSRETELMDVDLVGQKVWADLEALFLKYKVERPIIFTDPTQHLEHLFYLVCRSVHIPASCGAVYNLDLTIEMIIQVQPDALVTHENLARILSSQMLKKNLFPEFKFTCILPHTSNDDLDQGVPLNQIPFISNLEYRDCPVKYE